MRFSIIVATDGNSGIGKKEDDTYFIPWRSRIDMKYFKNVTEKSETGKRNAIIVGRNTYFTLPKKNGICMLYNRLNIVLTSQPDKIPNHENVKTSDSLDNALMLCQKEKNIDKVFVIGGSNVYKEALESPKLEYIYWNLIINNIHSKPNIFFPMTFEQAVEKFEYDKMYNLNLIANTEVVFRRLKIKNENLDEKNYLKLLEKIYNIGDFRQTRNAKTKSLFGERLEFDLKDKFPLITTKKMFLRGIFEELLWFLRGDTDSKILEAKKVKIWKFNTTKEFIDDMGLSYREGDIGNMYGFQWKHNGAEYNGCDNNYTGKGFDQIKYCLDLLKKDKYSRRIIMTTYSPYNAHQGVLYPCHGLMTQWYVREENNINYLSCHMYQRSADMFLGVPFNISSYSLLTYMFCNVLNNSEDYDGLEFKPDKLVISFGDLHIYEQHFEQVNEQIKRLPFNFPKLKIKKELSNLTDFEWSDILIENYNHYSSIKGMMIA